MDLAGGWVREAGEEDWSDSQGAEHLRCDDLGIVRDWSWTLI